MGQARAQQLDIPTTTIDNTGKGTLGIGVDCDTILYYAFQMDVSLPKGITMEMDSFPVIHKTGRLPESYPIISNYQRNKDLWSFNSFGDGRTGIAAGSGPIVTITLFVADDVPDGTYTATVSNIVFSSEDVRSIRYQPSTFTIVVDRKACLLDEASTTAPVASKGTVNATMKRTLKGGEWSTICLPFDMTGEQMKAAFGDDVQLSEYEGYEASEETDADDNPLSITVNFNAVNLTDGLKANEPYLIKPAKDVAEFTVDGVTVNPNEVTKGTKRRGRMFGSYVADFTVPKENLYVKDGELYYSFGRTKINGFSCYLELPEILSAYYTDTTSSVKVNMQVKGISTGINQIETTKSSGNVYSLDGQLVSQKGVKGLPQGIYVSNGKKVVVK